MVKFPWQSIWKISTFLFSSATVFSHFSLLASEYAHVYNILEETIFK